MGGKSPKASALGERRRTGVYYTPPYLARFLCRESLSRFVATRSSLPLDDAERFIACEACSDVPASISSRLDLIDSSLRGVSVIDPAVGTGVMLVTMLEELVNARVKIYKSAGREPPVEDFYEAAIVNSLHGVDINTEAVQTARSAIIGSRADDNGTTAAGVSAAMGSHIVAGNALAEIGKSIDHGIFDIVISNPPYLSYYGNAPVRIGEAEKHSLREDYDLFSQSNQRINAMNLFIELGVKLLKEGGILSYVVNKTLCVLPSYRKTRAYLLSNCTINRLVVDLDPFDAIVDCATLCVSKTKPPPNYTLSWCSLKGIPTNPASLASAIASRQMRIPVNQFARNRRLEFTYSPHEPILQKLERAAHRLGDILLINRGVNIGGCSEHFLSKTAFDDRYEKILLDARHIGRYRAWWDGSQGFLNFDQERERVLRDAGKTLVLGDPSRFEGPKLFIPEASKGIKAAYVDSRMYSAYGILVAKSKGDVGDLKLACALLNSRAISFYAIEREILRKGKKATPHVGVKGINEIPVPAFSHRARETIIRFVDEILEPNSGSAELANKATPVVNKAALTGIDRVIYEAFDLDAGEITSIDGAVDPLFE